MARIIRFDEVTADAVGLVGGKGANLGRLTTANFPVPAGFIVPTDAYADFLDACGLRATLQSVVCEIDSTDATALDKSTAEIRQLIAAAPMPAGTANDIRNGYAALGDGIRVAVRSSGTAEDLAGASFAGQHDSYLHIRGADAVVDAVKRCWASLWTARAVAYREHNGFTHDEVGIAVVVQCMIASEVSGVMFTANPIVALTNEICINASWGLGESVVSGLVTPDSFILDERTLVVKERQLGTKDKQIQLDDSGAGTSTREVAPADRDRFALTDAQLVELGELGRRVMAHYEGLPQDIEWGLVDGTFHVLQARPVTGALFSWDQEAEYWQQGSDDPNIVWTRSMADIAWTGAITPLFFSARAEAWYVAMAEANKLFGLHDLAKRRYIKYYRGTMYTNTEVDNAWLKTFVPATVRPRMLANADPLRHEEILASPSNPFALLKLYARIQLLEPKHGVKAWVKIQDDYTRNRRAEAAGMSDEQIASMSDQALVDYIEDRIGWEKQYGIDISTGYFVHFMVAGQLLFEIITRWYRGTNPMALMDLLTGSETPGPTAVENLKLWQMSRHIHNSPTLTELFRANPGAAFFARLDAGDGGREGEEFKATYDAFVVEHGPRGHADRDIYFIRRIEDPAVDYRVLEAFLAVDPDHTPEAIEEAARARKRAAVEDITANLRSQPLGTVKAEIFRIVNAYNQKLLSERDVERGFADISTFAFKRPLVELNRRAMKRGLFEDERDFYFLSRRELYDVFFGRANMPLTQAKIAGRKHNFDLVNEKQRVNPMYLRNNRELVVGDDTDVGLRGIPTSGGVATGTARLVKSLDEISRVKQGEIMVCNSTDPGWTPVFLLLGGVVFETGGAFAHCSCISREYGVPAIQVGGALRKIPDGATITIDGNTGTITVHDEEASIHR